MSPRRVVLVTTHYPPLVGGAATFFFLLAKALAAQGNHVTVLTTAAVGQPLATISGVTVCRLIPSLAWAPGVVRRWVQMVVTFKYLTWLRIRRQVDVIHTHASKSVTVGSGLASQLWHIPIVFEVQDFLSRPRALKMGWRRKYIATGQPVTEHLRRLGIPLFDIVTIPSIPPDELRTPLIDQHKNPARVLFVGEFHREVKGENILLEAFSRVRAVHPEAELVMVGDGPDRAADEALVQEKGIGGAVKIRGVLSPAEVAIEMDQAAFLVMSSHTEGMPRVILEAFARGLPIVATRVGGIPEAVKDEQNGLLVPPNDPTALAGAMNRLIGDPEAQKKFGLAGRAWVDSLPNWAELAKKIATAYPW